MSRINHPKSDHGRQALLNTATQADGIDDAKGERRLLPRIASDVSEKAGAFQTICDTADRCETQQQAASKTFSANLNALEQDLIALWSAVRCQVRAKRATTALYRHYKMTQNGRSPRRRRDTLLPLAADVLNSHYAAQHLGVPLFDVSQVEASLMEARAAKDALQQLTDVMNAAQTERKALRKVVDRLIRATAGQLRSSLLHETPVDRRKIIRNYGFTFDTDSTVASGTAADSPAVPETATGEETIAPAQPALEDNAKSVTEFVVASEEQEVAAD